MFSHFVFFLRRPCFPQEIRINNWKSYVSVFKSFGIFHPGSKAVAEGGEERQSFAVAAAAAAATTARRNIAAAVVKRILLKINISFWIFRGVNNGSRNSEKYEGKPVCHSAVRISDTHDIRCRSCFRMFSRGFGEFSPPLPMFSASMNN